MPQNPRQPHVKQRADGQYVLHYTDAATGKRVRVLCEREKATSAKARKDLLAKTVQEQRDLAEESKRRGGNLAYDLPLLAEVEAYRADVQRRKELREGNPEARQGLSAAAALEATATIDRFITWLKARHPRMACGRLDTTTLDSFFSHLATEPTKRGMADVKRSAATLAKHRRNVRTCLRWIDALRPVRFPDFAQLSRAFKGASVSLADTKPPVAYTPAELSAFLDAALEREAPDRTVPVTRHKRYVVTHGKVVTGAPEKTYDQPAIAIAATPVSRLFLLLALTGCRLGEALNLKWSDVDVERARINIRANKTGRTRTLILTKSAEGEIAPALAKLLKHWKLEAGGREYVLPHGDLAAPIFPKRPWAAVANKCGTDVSPQRLRQTFVSYAASVGIPATIAALLTGHSATVAERWYRAQLMERGAGDSIEAAMGLTGMVEKLRTTFDDGQATG